MATAGDPNAGRWRAATSRPYPNTTTPDRTGRPTGACSWSAAAIGCAGRATTTIRSGWTTRRPNSPTKPPHQEADYPEEANVSAGLGHQIKRWGGVTEIIIETYWNLDYVIFWIIESIKVVQYISRRFFFAWNAWKAKFISWAFFCLL